MQIDPTLFRAYDIRGVIPDQLDVEGARHIGRAFADYLQYPETVVVGRDVRRTGPELHAAAIEGLTAGGVNVLDIGQVSTDEYYFACGQRSLPGMMVTASHNPAQYNGFKLVEAIPRLAVASEFKAWVFGRTYEDAAAPGAVEAWDLKREFDDHVLGLVNVEAIKPLKVVIDTSNGALGPVWERLAERLPITVIGLCFEPDGSFPSHGNDIVQPENQQLLRDAVSEHGADLGLIFDPDGDRCLAVDDRGRSVPGDYLTALLAVTRLRHDPGSTIVYDVRCSEAVPDLVRAAGGEPLMWRPGHVYLKPKMVEHNAVFGGELSGHMYFREFWYSDSGTLTGLTLMEYVSQLDGPLSAQVAELEDKYALSGEINFRVPDVEAVLANVRARYGEGGRVSELSGYGVWYEDWKFVVRPSDNEPLVRLTVEARTPAEMAARRDELSELIRGT